ncbi:MAG: hypothetical protein MJ252_29495 [archaeon]|nr:hypothetical protein [archaeon]
MEAGHEDEEEQADKMSPDDIRNKLMDYEIKRWQEDRGKYVEFDIKTMKKYNKYYEEMKSINPEEDQEGIGVEQLEEPFISFGLAGSRDEINTLITSVDDDGSGRIEFPEFLRIIHNTSKLKTKGNEKITNFFKDLANNKLGGGKDLTSFSFKTVMGIVRRQNLLNAFLIEDKDETTTDKKDKKLSKKEKLQEEKLQKERKKKKEQGMAVLKAYSEMLSKKKAK